MLQTYRYPADCSRHLSADLRAAELQDHAIGVLQLNASSAGRDRAAGSDRAVRAFDRSWPLQIERSSNKLGGRGSDREADAHARYGERIALASEDQHALAAPDSDDESALGEYDRDLAGFSPRWRTDASYAQEQCNQSNACSNFLMTLSL